MNLKNIRARKLPKKLKERKIHELAQIYVLPYQNMTERTIAGFTGLAYRVFNLVPASIMAPMYEPANIIV
jgi:hypothetical protein